jgi:hypothetical protein
MRQSPCIVCGEDTNVHPGYRPICDNYVCRMSAYLPDDESRLKFAGRVLMSHKSRDEIVKNYHKGMRENDVSSGS